MWLICTLAKRFVYICFVFLLPCIILPNLILATSYLPAMFLQSDTTHQTESVRALTCFLQDMKTTSASFQTSTLAASQEKSAICPLPLTWAYRHPQLASVCGIDPDNRASLYFWPMNERVLGVYFQPYTPFGQNVSCLLVIQTKWIKTIGFSPFQRKRKLYIIPRMNNELR